MEQTGKRKWKVGLVYGLVTMLVALLLMIPLVPSRVEAATATPKATVTKKTLYVGYKNYQIRVKNAASTAKITYASNNAKVAKVTSKGVIKPVKAGKATITVKIVQNKKTYQSKIAVTVKNPYLQVHLKKTSLVQSSDYKLVIGVYGLADAMLEYKSSNVLVAKIDENGMLHARGEGKTTITVTDATSGLSTSYTLKVYKKTPENMSRVYIATTDMDKEYVYVAPEITEDMAAEEKEHIEYMTDIQNKITKGVSITMQQLADYYEEKSAHADDEE